MDFTFKVLQKEIPCKFGEPVNFHIWGDVHYETDACHKEGFHKFVKQAVKIPNSYYIGMGDYHDFASFSEQKALSKAGLHDQSFELFDRWVGEHNRKFAEIIKPMGGKLLGLIGGNHTWKLQNGYYADEDLAQRMETDYLGWLCVLSLKFVTNSHNRILNFVLCHGKGGGKLIGTSINNVNDLRQIFPSATVFVMGHDHQRMAVPVTSLGIESGRWGAKVKAHHQWLVRSGSFLRSYEDGKAQYTTAKLYKPASLGAVMLSVTLNRDQRKQEDGREDDIFFTITATT